MSEILGVADDARAQVLAAAAAVPAEEMHRPPTAGRWSPAQVLDHLASVERGVVRLLEKKGGAAKAAGLTLDASTDSLLRSLDQYDIATTRKPVIAPVQVEPSANARSDGALHSLEESRRALNAIVAELDGFDLTRVTHVHPLLGELNLYQWILFVGQHELRHIPQFRSVR